jgi:phosphopantothenoylcysteine decarboxylase / phosphopantothenate---cysteine ligase
VKVVLGISGGIAAYKGPDLVRRLQDAGASVRVILTPNAARFVSPLSLAAVSGAAVTIDQWGDPERGGVDHIELARWADLLLIAPATANMIAKLATGIADDALSTYAVAHRGAVAVAPAMNTFMLAHPTVQENLARLRARGVEVIAPDAGLLACGDEGAGRMPDPPLLVERLMALHRPPDLTGLRILITAGPTREPIDPVRYISNRSSGKMGYAIATAAVRRGADVTLISGPTALSAPDGVHLIRVMTAAEMYEATLELAPEVDAVIKAAAVSDFTPVAAAASKIKRQEEPIRTLELQATPDILEAVGRLDKRPFVVAFAAETEKVEEHAAEKLHRKNADLIVANDVSDPSIGFDVDHNRVSVISRSGEVIRIERALKAVIADRLLDLVAQRITEAGCVAARAGETSHV